MEWLIGSVHGSCWSPVPCVGLAGHLDCTTSSTNVPPRVGRKPYIQVGLCWLRRFLQGQALLSQPVGNTLRLDSLVERNPGTRRAGLLLSWKAPVLVVKMLKYRVLCLLPTAIRLLTAILEVPPPIQFFFFFSFYHCVLNFILYINLPFSSLIVNDCVIFHP